MFTLELIDKFLVAGKYEEKKLNFCMEFECSV